MPLRRRQQHPPAPQSETFTDSDEIDNEDDEDMLESEEMMGDEGEEVEGEDEDEEDEEEPLGEHVSLFSSCGRCRFLYLLDNLPFPFQSTCIELGPGIFFDMRVVYELL
jgi:hypothetical protein